MNAHDLLRTHALNDLRRLIPPAHYWMREHEPTADRELTDPLLSEPVRFELTPREHVAARALFNLATYRLRSRAIWSIAFSARDIDSPTESPGMTPNDEHEVTAWLEVFRRSALVYARVVGDLHLIECFQPPPPDAAAPMPAGAIPTPAIADDEWKDKARDAARGIVKRATALGQYPSQKALADEISRDFRTRGIVGADGKPLSGATIKRHALKGISSAMKKAQSTTLSRGN